VRPSHLTIGGLPAALLAAALVAPLGGLPEGPIERDSARAAWCAGSPSPFYLFHTDSTSLERERFDPLLRRLFSPLADCSLAFDLHRAVGLGLCLFFLFLHGLDLGLGAAWAAAALSLSSLGLAPIARLGHPLWLASPWPGVLAFVLGRLWKHPSPAIVAMAAGALVAWRVGSESLFLAGLPLLIGLSVAIGQRSALHAKSSLAFAAVAVALAAWPSGLPSPPLLLVSSANPLSVREILPLVDRSEAAILAATLLLGVVAFALDRRVRPVLLAAAALGWASFDWRTPGWGPLDLVPPLRLSAWSPGGEEHALPVLFAPVALALVAFSVCRVAGGRLPRWVGGLIASFVLALLLRGALDAGVFSRSPEGSRSTEAAQSTPAVLAWPADPNVVAARLRAGKPTLYANLDSETLPDLAPALALRPSPFWSEGFWSVVSARRIRFLEVLQGDPPEAPPGAIRPSRRAGLYRLRAAAALARYRALEPLAKERWGATSNTADPARLPESAAFDGDPETRWGTGGPQTPGQFFELDLGSVVEGVTRIVLESGRWESDWPRGLALETVTDDGTTTRLFEDPRPLPQHGRIVLDFPPAQVRRLRLVQLGRHRLLDWSIAELSLWREAKP
jgi:hypothetical protein